MEDWTPRSWFASRYYPRLYQFPDPRYWENRWEKDNNPQLSEGDKDMPDQTEKFYAFHVVVYNDDDGTVYFKDTVTAKDAQLAERHVLRHEIDADVPDDVKVLVRPF